MSKLRSDSILASLTEPQRDQLYDWLLGHTYPEVQELTAKPVDEGGFALKFHRTTLTRFFEKEQQERHAEELAELALNAEEGQTHPAVEQLLRASKARFAHALYDLANAQTDPLNFDRLERALHHIAITDANREALALKKRELDLQQVRMDEQRRQWEYNASRAALNHLPELLKIAQDRSTDNEGKIWAARDICFGKSPTPSPEPDQAPPADLQPPSLESEPSVVTSENSSVAPAAPLSNSVLSPQSLQLVEISSAVSNPIPQPSSLESPQLPDSATCPTTQKNTKKHTTLQTTDSNSL